MGRLRATGVLGSFLGLTLPLMPVQAALLRLAPEAARRFPHWYHRRVCALMGIRVHVQGHVTPGVPTLLVSNHTSWLDIPVLSAVAPVSFVAKKEVGGWPFVSSLARLQRTVFVDRQRRTAVGATANEIAQRLATGDAIVLFAEGTSTDGNRVLPFKSSLFAAAKPTGEAAGADMNAVVQSVAIVYQRLHGIPLGRADRPLVGWYGDMDMQSHAWQLLQAGPLDVTVIVGPPVPLADFADRKALAERSEAAVRETVVRALRARPDDEPFAVAAPPPALRRSAPVRSAVGKFR